MQSPPSRYADGRVFPCFDLYPRVMPRVGRQSLKWCRRLLEADLRQMAISLTVGERPL